MQELNERTPTPTNLLTGLGIDEYFTRTDSSGTSTFATDALGSTLAVMASGGNTFYTYEPFGNTTVSGSNTNPYQFTGRENDGTGLYYYRARYYSPTFRRFIAQDPIGFAGGDTNLYGYVQDNPINGNDPVGLCDNTPRPCPPVPLAPPGVSVNMNIQNTREIEGTSFFPSWWLANVFPRGNWDYKTQGSQYDRFGNFNYGATGAAAGIPESILLLGAGAAKWSELHGNDPWGSPWGGYPWGNEPGKQNDIANGFQYFSNGCWH